MSLMHILHKGMKEFLKYDPNSQNIMVPTPKILIRSYKPNYPRFHRSHKA